MDEPDSPVDGRLTSAYKRPFPSLDPKHELRNRKLDIFLPKPKFKPKTTAATLSPPGPGSRDPVLLEATCLRFNKKRVHKLSDSLTSLPGLNFTQPFYSQTGRNAQSVTPRYASNLGNDTKLNTPMSRALVETPAMEREISSASLPDRMSTERVTKTSEMQYMAACVKFSTLPVSIIQRNIQTTELKLRGYRLRTAGVRALAAALVKNITVTILDVAENQIQTEGARAIATMLSQNNTITDLDLSENPVDTLAIKELAAAIWKKNCLRKLKISGMNIKDDSARYLSQVLEENVFLQELRLSKNHLSENGGLAIAKGLASNISVRYLDLSWNHIRGKGAVALAKALRKNCTLRYLDVSWNGFGLTGCDAMAKTLSSNDTLLEINLAANRIFTPAALALIRGIQRNRGLIKITLKLNSITPKVATRILQAVIKMPERQLEELDIEDVPVELEFLDLKHELLSGRPIVIRHGPAIKKGIDVHREHSGFYDADPRTLLFYIMEKEGLRVIDLFKQLDVDGSNSLTRTEFKNGLVKQSMPISDAQLDNLVDMLDEDKDGHVELGEMLRGERMFKRQRLANKGKFKLPRELRKPSPPPKEQSNLDDGASSDSSDFSDL